MKIAVLVFVVWVVSGVTFSAFHDCKCDRETALLEQEKDDV